MLGVALMGERSESRAVSRFSVTYLIAGRLEKRDYRWQTGDRRGITVKWDWGTV
jgi:hypothetical protein